MNTQKTAVHKKLTLTADEQIYDGLHHLIVAYQEMAADDPARPRLKSGLKARSVTWDENAVRSRLNRIQLIP